MRVRSSAVLFVLAVMACAPSARLSRYTPKWRVGDWWVVKEWAPGMASGWHNKRYDVLRTEELGDVTCYVLQLSDSAAPGCASLACYYVRCDNWRTIRQSNYFEQRGRLIGPGTFDCPSGMFGPLPAEPQLPPFPLVAAAARGPAPGTSSSNPLRQSSLLADSIAMNRYRAEPDTTGGRPVKPVGRTYLALSELVKPAVDGGPDLPYMYVLQLWSKGYPWRLYEERGNCDPETGARQPEVRSWLVDWGHVERK